MADHVVAASAAVIEWMEDNKEGEEDEEEENMEDGFSTEDLASKQAPAWLATVPMAPVFWAAGPSDKVAG